MMKTFQTIFLATIISTVVLAPIWAAETNTMSKDQANKLIASHKFKAVKSKSEIPKLWWKAMDLDRLSDIGGPFDVGCTGSGPHNRLVAAAVSEPYALAISEQGGIAYFMTFRLYKHNKDAVTQVYDEDIREPRRDEIIKQLARN